MRAAAALLQVGIITTKAARFALLLRVLPPGRLQQALLAAVLNASVRAAQLNTPASSELYDLYVVFAS
jgi:hypothetical protein